MQVFASSSLSRISTPASSSKTKGGVQKSVSLAADHSVMSYHVSLRRYCRLIISPAILPHSFQARELSGAPPRALAQCSSEWPLSRFRGAAELPQEAAAPTEEESTSSRRPPSRSPRSRRAATAEPKRSGIASVTAESRCPPRRLPLRTLREVEAAQVGSGS